MTKIELPQKVQAPVLVVVGQKETIVARHAAQHLCKEIEGARGVMVPGWAMPGILKRLIFSPDLFEPESQIGHYPRNWYRSKTR